MYDFVCGPFLASLRAQLFIFSSTVGLLVLDPLPAMALPYQVVEYPLLYGPKLRAPPTLQILKCLLWDTLDSNLICIVTRG